MPAVVSTAGDPPDPAQVTSTVEELGEDLPPEREWAYGGDVTIVWERGEGDALHLRFGVPDAGSDPVDWQTIKPSLGRSPVAVRALASGPLIVAAHGGPKAGVSPGYAVGPELQEAFEKAARAYSKGGKHEEAMRYFALAAVGNEDHELARKVAAAASLAKKPKIVEAALAESVKRGGDAARELARKDEGLAAYRSEPWFEAALSGKAAGG